MSPLLRSSAPAFTNALALAFVLAQAGCRGSDAIGTLGADPVYTGTRPFVPEANSRLVVDSFSVREIAVSPTEYMYVPELRVREVGNGANAAVLSLRVDVAGTGAPPACNTSIIFAAASTKDLIELHYGDYSYYIDSSERATDSTATVVLKVSDGVGAGRLIEATGRIVPDSRPIPYTNGDFSWQCSP